MGERGLMGRGAELSVPLFLGEEAKRMLMIWIIVAEERVVCGGRGLCSWECECWRREQLVVARLGGRFGGGGGVWSGKYELGG